MKRLPATAFVMALGFIPATLSAQSQQSINMNMSIDADGEQMNMNISIDGNEEQMNMNIEMDGSPDDDWGQSAPAMPASSPTPTGPHPMDDLDFERYLNAIRGKDFEDSKLTTAKAPLRGQYLTAEQIGQVMKAFDFEDTRLDFAIFAHPRCVDQDNYYLTYGAFEFELSIEELEDAIHP